MWDAGPSLLRVGNLGLVSKRGLHDSACTGMSGRAAAYPTVAKMTMIEQSSAPENLSSLRLESRCMESTLRLQQAKQTFLALPRIMPEHAPADHVCSSAAARREGDATVGLRKHQREGIWTIWVRLLQLAHPTGEAEVANVEERDLRKTSSLFLSSP